MNIFKDMSAGRVLDVATGQGGFAGFLAQTVKDQEEIVGIDTSERLVNAARSAIDQALAGIDADDFCIVLYGLCQKSGKAPLACGDV